MSRLGRHYGTALPGLVASWIDPTLLAGFRERLGPVVLVVGANGKTTTTRLTATVIERATGCRPISNRSGANMPQGILSALIADRRGELGRLPAVFEVDEFALSRVADALRPDVIVMLNLLRDQLDRYGEIDAIARRWSHDISRLPDQTQLVVCADDPRLESLVSSANRPVKRFGLALASGAHPAASPDHTGGIRPDSVPCPRCGERVDVVPGSKSGLGPWQCPSCGLARSQLDLSVAIDDPDDLGWLVLKLGGPALEGIQGTLGATVRVRLSGSGGAHDTGAAVLAAIALGISPRTACAAVNRATPAFGRLEEIRVDERRLVLTLAKNPASVAEAAEAAAVRRPDGVLIGLADRPADGRDVSWIWDAPLDALLELAPVTLTGNRAADLALRLKYATSLESSQHRPSPIVQPEIEDALDGSLSRIRPGGTLMVLATYTALLGIRRVLEQRGFATALPR